MILENFKEDLNESKYNISIDDSMSLIFVSYEPQKTNNDNSVKRIEMRKEATILLSEEIVRDTNITQESVEKAKTYIKLLSSAKTNIAVTIKCLLEENLRMYQESKRCFIKAAKFCVLSFNFSGGPDRDEQQANRYEKNEEKRQKKDKKRYNESNIYTYYDDILIESKLYELDF